MPTLTKNIKVHYFRVALFDSVSNKWVDGECLDKILESISSLDVMDRRLPAHSGSDEVRLQVAEKRKSYWKLQFVKVRISVIPNKVNAAGEFQQILLNDDEFVGEDVTCIYSPGEQVMAIQRNHYSVTSNKICEFFNYMRKMLGAGSEDREYIFEPLIDSNQKEVKYKTIRSLEFSCVDLNNQNIDDVIKNTGNYFGAKNMLCRVSIDSHEKGNVSLNLKKAWEFILQAVNNKSMRVLKAKVKMDMDSHVETIDFLEQRIETSFKIDYSKNQPITHIRIWHKMQELCPEVFQRIRG